MKEVEVRERQMRWHKRGDLLVTVCLAIKYDRKDWRLADREVSEGQSVPPIDSNLLAVASIRVRETTFGVEDERAIDSTAVLGGMLRDSGRWKEVRAMEMRQARLRLDHPDTLISMGNLALTYYDHGQWKQAEELQTGAVKKYDKRTRGGPSQHSHRRFANIEYLRIDSEESAASAGGLTL